MKGKLLLLIIGISLLVQNINAYPRDSSVIKTESFSQDLEQKSEKDLPRESLTPVMKTEPTSQDSELKSEKDHTKHTEKPVMKTEPTSQDSELKSEKDHTKHTEKPELFSPYRVKCDYEEATEDENCQNHCLPKGYSYGICVRGTCSCI